MSVRIVSSWEFQFPEGWHITAKLYLCIVPLALVYFSYTFIENPDYPSNEKRGNLLLCQKSMWPHLSQCFRRRYLLVCIKNEWPWDHQGWNKGAWLGLGRRMSKDRRPVSLGRADDGANEYFHQHPLSCSFHSYGCSLEGGWTRPSQSLLSPPQAQ